MAERHDRYKQANIGIDPYSVGGVKKCTTCEEWVPITDYYRNGSQPTGLESRCSYCSRSAISNRRHGQKGFKITKSEYDRLDIGWCHICGDENKKLHIDHDHLTGQVRGLLCFDCNTGIGKLQHDKSILLAAVIYLDKQLERGNTNERA